jgi:diguanylate cyclase (GGDEF)-like protein
MLIRFIVYLALSIAAVLSIKVLSYIPEQYLPVVKLLPFVLATTAILLGFKFNRSQLVLYALLITAAYTWFFITTSVPSAKEALILNGMAALLTLNVTLIASYSERGLFNTIGFWRLILLVLPVIGFSWLVNHQYNETHQFIYQTIFPAIQIHFLFFTQLTLLVILISFFLLCLLFFLSASPFHIALLSGLVISLYAITYPAEQLMIIALLMTWALLIPLITLISESWRMAYLDELTGLPGRRALNEKLNKLGSKYVIAMLDVDHFKKFNDTYGHDAGDDVLRLLGNKLKAVAGGGKPFRYGGEEFTVVFSGTELDKAKQHLENLRQSIAEKKFTIRKQERRSTAKESKKSRMAKSSRDVKVTISIGVAQRNDKASTTTQVLKAADKALYRAKKKGRNCVSL